MVFFNYHVLCLYRKVEQVSEEVDSLRESLDKYTFRNQKRMTEARERAELLQRAVSGSCI